jgi:hypothetical protein
MKMTPALAILGIASTMIAFPLAQASAATMKECAAEWQKMKAANQTEGKTYRAFSKDCMSKDGAAAATPAAAPASAPATTTKPAATTAAKPAASGGRQAMYARERACGAEWREAKAAGKIPAGQKWPQYWSECNKRKKAAGM